MNLTKDELLAIEKETGEPASCDCCGYPSKEMSEYGGPVTSDGPGGKGKSILCEICAGTFLSHCITYPRLYGSQRHLFSSIGWIANHLQDEIRKLKGE